MSHLFVCVIHILIHENFASYSSKAKNDIFYDTGLPLTLGARI